MIKTKEVLKKHAWHIAAALVALALVSDGIVDTRFAHSFPTEYFIAKAYADKNDNAKALTYFESALEKWPGYAELMHDYGQALIRNGSVAEGVSWMEKARDADPQCAFIRKNLGQIYRKEADRQAARSEGPGGKQNATSKKAFAVLVQMAVREYEAAERLDSFDRSIKYDLALLYERAGRKDDFRRKLNEFVDLAKDVKGEEEWVRISRRMLEDDYKHGKAFNNSPAGGATTLTGAAIPKDAGASLDAAQYNLRGGNYEEASKNIQAAIAADPNSTSAYALLGNYNKKIGNLPEAEKAYHKAIELEPENVLALNNLANIYRDTERYDEAEKYYQRALAIAPDNPVIKKNQARMKEMSGR